MNELVDSIMGSVEENTLDLSIEDAIDVLNDVIGQCIARVEGLESDLE